MSIVFRVKQIEEKRQEIIGFLTDYWGNDIWNITDPFFDEFRSPKWTLSNKTFDFSCIQPGVKDEVKFFFANRIEEHTLTLRTSVTYGSCFAQLANFLKQAYPRISSFTCLEIEMAMTRWHSYLVEQGFFINKKGWLSSSCYEVLLQQLYQYTAILYDNREEFEKDVWDVRKIPGARYTQNNANYLLSFEDISLLFRPLVKRYLKVRIGIFSYSQCTKDLGLTKY